MDRCQNTEVKSIRGQVHDVTLKCKTKGLGGSCLFSPQIPEWKARRDPLTSSHHYHPALSNQGAVLFDVDVSTSPSNS